MQPRLTIYFLIVIEASIVITYHMYIQYSGWQDQAQKAIILNLPIPTLLLLVYKRISNQSRNDSRSIKKVSEQCTIIYTTVAKAIKIVTCAISHRRDNNYKYFNCFSYFSGYIIVHYSSLFQYFLSIYHHPYFSRMFLLLFVYQSINFLQNIIILSGEHTSRIKRYCAACPVII